MAQDTAHIETAFADSITMLTDSALSVADTVETAPAGLVIIDPMSAYDDVADSEAVSSSVGFGMSWIYLGLTVLFCAIGLKIKGSSGYLRALISDLTDTRVRSNAFDDTVKESSLIVLLNVMWTACSGILLWIGIRDYLPSDSGLNLSENNPAGILLCMIVAAAYLLVMMAAYWIVGNVFSDSRQTRLWVKGAAASMGLQAFLLFPLTLVALNYPTWCATLLVIAFIVFLAGKIIFLYQGFRIFFSQISSWLLFLYYLCSLEIIPVILTLAATLGLCTDRL